MLEPQKDALAATRTETQEKAQHEFATIFILRLGALEQATRLYDLNNSIVVKILNELVEAANSFETLTGETLSISLAGYSFFANKRLIRMDYSSYKKAEILKKLWDRVGMGELSLPSKLSVNQFKEFSSRWISAISDPANQATLYANAWGGIEARQSGGDDQIGKRIRSEVFITRTYCALIVLIRQTIDRFSRRQRIPALRIKRSLQSLTDHLSGYSGLILTIARKPELRGDLAGHLVSTTVLSMVIAEHAGVKRSDIVTLGMAALFHDLPKTGLNDSTLNSIESLETLSSDDSKRVSQHWLNQVAQFINISGFSEDTVARVVTMYESQLEFKGEQLYLDNSGEQISQLSLLSELIQWVDIFDTAAWTRPGKTAMTAHEGIRAMLAKSGGTLSPLMGLVLKTVGIYPMGSALRLMSGDYAIVIAQGAHPTKPIVRIIGDKNGRSVKGEVVDLSLVPNNGVHSSVMMSELDINPVSAFAKFKETDRSLS